MMIELSNSDKFGFYLVNGRKTYSKLEAFEWAKYDSVKIEWNFNKDAFSLYDWKIEPTYDLNYFYDKRAKELREKYDYIVLWYSGGYDSHNILKTFIDNDLHLDEILTVFPRKDIMNEERYEYENYTIKKLEKYKDKLGNTKITASEYVDMFLDMIDNDISCESVLYGINSKISNFTMIRSKIKKELYKKYIESGKKVCFLFGIDKPAVQIKDNHFYANFSDNVIATYMSAQEQIESKFAISNEFFYWSPDCVSMIIKQAHTLKKKYQAILQNNDSHQIIDLLKQKYKSNLSSLRTNVFGSGLKNISFLHKSSIQNTSLYPRCLIDDDTDYFNSGISGVYHKKIEKLFIDRQTMEKNRIYRCMGLRNAWFYTGNSEQSVKMRKVIEHLISKKALFAQNDVYQNMKTFYNSYRL